MAAGRPEFEKFDSMTRKILSVSREELRRREAKWKKQRKTKKAATKKRVRR